MLNNAKNPTGLVKLGRKASRGREFRFVFLIETYCTGKCVVASKIFGKSAPLLMVKGGCTLFL